MTLLDRATATRIDRLSRRAHAFHRFAHHPLCGAYAGEVIRIGKRVRLCRGCSYLGLGLAAGAGAASALPMSWFVSAAHASWLCSALALSAWLGASSARVNKLVKRALPAASLALAIGLGVRLGTLLGLALSVASALVFAGLALRYRLRGPDRTPCASCPERTLPVCSGFLPIVRRERAFRRASRRLLLAAQSR